LNASDFGKDFSWGVSTSAYQIEGAHTADEKGPSIWDVFSNTKGKIKNNHTGNDATDFYHRYQEDLLQLKALKIKNFRFSISWSRILPNGTGKINFKGILFYHHLIDFCLDNGITPWITLYHWDLPYELEKKGGWTNREIIHWFREYVEICMKHFGSKVKYWMVLNEPIVFTGAGYFLGIHAPGRTGLKNFLPAIHHASLCQKIGFSIIKNLFPQNEVGTTFSFSHIEPINERYYNVNASKRVDAIINRLAIEPTLGLLYPQADLDLLHAIDKYVKQNDLNALQTPFDFVGVQVYTREIVQHSFFVPYLKAKLLSAEKRSVPRTMMNWEIHPPSLYEILKKISAYSGVKKIIVTENGAAFHDIPSNKRVPDEYRINYLRKHIAELKRARDEGINVQGYFIWSFTDNFEWSEGYHPRFGIVYVDFKTQERIVKDSGYWYRDFLSNSPSPEKCTTPFLNAENIFST
jgi:beta-glucosidase